MKSRQFLLEFVKYINSFRPIKRKCWLVMQMFEAEFKPSAIFFFFISVDTHNKMF